MPRKKAPWSKTIEESGVSVRLYERAVGSLLYREVRLEGRKDRKSLGHRDRGLAERQARQLARRIAELRYAGHAGPVTMGQLFLLYRQHRLPLLSPERQRAVRGQLALLEHHFRRALSAEDLTPTDVEAYVAARQTGKIRSPRHRVPAPGVRAGTIRNELHLLLSVLRWARTHRVGGRRLLATHPLEGLEIPHEKNPRRPIATAERYAQTLAKADVVDPAGRLRVMLVLARHTGRRINAICQLRAADVLLSPAQVALALAKTGQDLRQAAEWPDGAIHWAPTSDKLGFEAITPIGPEVRAALEAYLRAHPRVGDAPLFPASTDAARPVPKVMAGYWLTKAETAAGLPKLERGGWHVYRRLWASERRHLPAQDVAAAGGWRSLEVMRSAYQHADAATVYAVVASPATGATGHRKDTRRKKGTARQHVTR